MNKTMKATVTSTDGTKIAYELAGNGQVLIIVLEALNSRKSGSKLAKLLAPHFTIISYDSEIMGEGHGLPVPLLKSISIPTRVMHGGAGSRQMRDSAQAITKFIPHAQFRSLDSQTHGVSPKALVPVLVEFFSD
jgi:hypothetical protein